MGVLVMANRGTSRAPGIWPRLPWLGRIHTANLSAVSAWPGCKALVSRPIRLDMFYSDWNIMFTILKQEA